MLVDSYGRTVDYLRVSVTERCNFRCQYCMPEKPFSWVPKENLLKFEELFYIQLNILQSKTDRNKRYRGNVFERVGDNFNTFYRDYLPFELTGAQKKVMKEIRKDMGSGRQMNRLLQGDVGCGKTLVALLSARLFGVAPAPMTTAIPPAGGFSVPGW